MPPKHSTEVGCHAAISPGRPGEPVRSSTCVGMSSVRCCMFLTSVRFDNQYASRGADGLVAWPASREAKVRHSLHRTSLAILPFPGLQVPWLPSSEWCRWGCGGRTRSGTARRRLAPGLAHRGWWWATVELSGLVARLGNSGQVEDGRDLRLLGHGVQGPLATPYPVVNHSEPPTVKRPQMHQEAARRENSIQRHGTIARAPDPSVRGLLVFPCCADACRGRVVSGV